ncbi:MAG: hypothetical protein OXH75_14940 [Acidobacteria bacterium]|nr:hypothetical protein [Acidobacteriota bacterium]
MRSDSTVLTGGVGARLLGCLATALLWIAPLANGAPEVLLVEITGVPVADVAAAGAAQAPRDGHPVHFFPAAGHSRGWQGLLRIANHADESGTLFVHAFDDGGTEYGPVEIGIGAGETIHVNSDDLEDGNAAKDLVGSTGRPAKGDWRLEVRSGLRLEVLSFVRTSDGFVTPMHAVAPPDAAASLKYRVVNFNRGRNLDQESLLRLVNRTAREAAVVIEAVDDTGMRGGRVRLAVPAGASRTLGAMELEQGGDFDGSLGSGSGKWRLEVWSDVPVAVLSLLAAPTGHLTNWSATPGASAGAMRPPPPSVSVVSPMLVEAEWVGSFESLFASFDLSVKYREGDEWELFLGCADFTESSRTATQRLTASISLGAPAEVGRVLWVRYRHRNESFCSSDRSSPGAWSHTGEALIRGEGVAPTRNPDLAVLAPSVDDPAPEPGGKFTLSAVVWNAGDDVAGATTLRYYRSSNPTISANDMEIGVDAVGGLAAEAESSESIPLTAPPESGTYHYGACVDPVSDETNTANNCSEGVKVEVARGGEGGAPDLVVEVPSVDDAAPDAGESIAFSATVRNRGDGPSEPTTLRYYRSPNARISDRDALVGVDSVAGLPAAGTGGESISLAVPSRPGTYYYGACVDSVAGESRRYNNCSDGVAVEVSGGGLGAPDLVVESPAVDDATPEGRESFTFSATVRNRGDGRSGATTLRYYRSSDYRISSGDVEVGADAVGELPAEGAGEESVSLTAPRSGAYWYGACVDPVSAETDAGNNCSNGIRVEVAGEEEDAPDLVVESAAVDDAAPEPGGWFTFSATVRNRGEGPSGSTTLRYFRSADSTISTGDIAAGTDFVGRLAAAATSDESIRLTAPSTGGTYYYGACVDSVSGESASANNCSDAVEVEVGGDGGGEGTPDLVVVSPAVDDDAPEAGASFTLSATVRNRGDGRSGSTTLRYYRSSNSTISSGDTEVGTDSVGGLAASATSDESIRLTAPSGAGTYYYGACVDAVTGESSTANNCSDGVEVEVSAGGGGGEDSYCRDGDRVDNGTECEIYDTDAVLEIDADGRFCTRNVPGVSDGCATDRVGGIWRIDARGGIRIYATRTTATYWTIDDVEPEPED